MTGWLLGLVPQYGGWLLLVCTFLSCLALPVPASMLLLCAGGFISAGDLPVSTVLAALAGASAGDQTIYALGRWRGAAISRRLGKRAAIIERAKGFLERRGGVGVFLSRWLFSALGPYVNFAAGFANLPWWKFTLWAVAGEIMWASIYATLGYQFTGNLAAASTAAVDFLMLMGAGVTAIGLGYWLYTIVQRGRNERP